MTFKFKGGPIFLNSGGIGPDDYLFKPIRGGRSTLVVFRWGRNFTGDVAEAEADREAAKTIHKFNQQICVPDMARRYQLMRAKHGDDIPTMSGIEFLARYGEATA